MIIIIIIKFNLDQRLGSSHNVCILRLFENQTNYSTVSVSFFRVPIGFQPKTDF